MKKVLLIAVALILMISVSAQDEKKTLCVDNFTNNTSYNDITVKNLQNEVVSGIMATGRLTIVEASTLGELPQAVNERVKALGEKGINYVLQGKLNSIDMKSKQSSDKKTTLYEAEVNYTLTVIDAETGETTATETKKESWTIGKTKDEAILKAIEQVKGNMKKFVDNNFKVAATVKALDQVDEKKGARTVYVTIGSNSGISKGQIFEVFSQVDVAGEKVNKKIGELKAKEVLSGTLTLCDVKSGGKEIQTAFQNGVQMTVISRAKKDPFGGLLGD